MYTWQYTQQIGIYVQFDPKIVFIDAAEMHCCQKQQKNFSLGLIYDEKKKKDLLFHVGFLV